MEEGSISRRQLFKNAAIWTGTGIVTAALTDRISAYLIDNNRPPSKAELLEEFYTKAQPKAVNLSLKDIECRPCANKQAILVKPEECRDDSVDIMQHLLSLYGYKCYVIEPDYATEDNIFFTLEQIAKRSNTEHQTIFYFEGHGNTIGNIYRKAIAVTGTDLHKSRITDIELIHNMSKIQGKKAVLIDACLSGAFVDYLRPSQGSKPIKDYVVISACPGDCVSLSDKFFIKNKQVGQLTYGLYNLLNFAEKPVNLSTDNIEIANEVYRQHLDMLNFVMREDKETKISFEMQRVSDTDFIL